MRKWRPSLAEVLGGALAATLALSFLGLIALRYLGPEIGFRNAAALLGTIIALLTAGLGWLLVRLLLRPVRELEAYARGLEAGGSVAPLRHFGTRETHTTAQQVIRMGEALRDRATTIRAYTDHVTHELKTPVSAIRAGTELLEDSPDLVAEDRAVLAQLVSAGRLMEDQLEALRAFTRSRETSYHGSARLEDILPQLQRAHPELLIEAKHVDLEIPLTLEGLGVVLGQLVQNAAHHGATHLILNADVSASKITVTLRDNGSGVSEATRAAMFEPFFTTRRDTGGTGMGLAIVHDVLRAHRAEIICDAVETGAQFRLVFHHSV